MDKRVLMDKRAVRKTTVLTGTAVAIGLIIAMLVFTVKRVAARDLTGVVLVDDPDIRKQRPIANVRVEAGELSGVTDASGLFQLKLPPSSLLTGLRLKRVPLNGVVLNLQHPDYVPLQLTVAVDGRIFVLRLKPTATGAPVTVPEIPVADIRVRYTESARTSQDTGSALKSFDIVNKGNVPCNGRAPCSPDGKWKAAIGGASLDAGEGNEFREARVSCVAGPCPFTRIEKDAFSRNARNISVAVRDWSDTVSFVLEAEVTRTSMSDLIRLSYPIILGRGLNFSLPPSGEGPSIEANVAGAEAVYPLGPSLAISWADCSLQVAKDLTKSYRCDLKPGYRFQ
jgi:hypothetical protein